MACDQHVVKMATETAQMLSTVCRLHDVNVGYKISHAKHPCTLWAGTTRENFDWLQAHGDGLCAEYTYRYGKVHAASLVLQDIREAANALTFEREGLLPFAKCMPEEFYDEDPIKAYRNFYLGSKARFARWRKTRSAPEWFIAGQVTQVSV